jgi:hypothetical protein
MTQNALHRCCINTHREQQRRTRMPKVVQSDASHASSSTQRLERSVDVPGLPQGQVRPHLDEHKSQRRCIGCCPNVAQRHLDSAAAHQHRHVPAPPMPSSTVPRRFPQTTKFSTTNTTWGGSVRVAAPVRRPKKTRESVFDLQKHSANTKSVRNSNTVIKQRETLEAVAKLREALRGELGKLGEQAERALDRPRDRRAAHQSRCAAR